MRFDETGSLSKQIKTSFFIKFKMNIIKGHQFKNRININLLQRAVEKFVFFGVAFRLIHFNRVSNRHPTLAQILYSHECYSLGLFAIKKHN